MESKVQTICQFDMPIPCVFVFLEQIEHLIVLNHILLYKKMANNMDWDYFVNAAGYDVGVNYVKDWCQDVCG